MRIVFYEMKKIWNTRLLLIVALLCALFYSIFMDFDIRCFPNGHPATEKVDFSTEMTQRYGPTLEDDEFLDLMKTREKLVSEAERYIETNPVFREAGIATYDDYVKISQKEEDQTEAEHRAQWALLDEECDFVQMKLQTLDEIKELYDSPPASLESLISETTNEKELARLTKIRQTEEYRNILDDHVYENTVDYTLHLAVLAILAVLVLVSPLLVIDRARNVHLLQYTTKHGRKILHQQFIAVILSAFLLTTVLLLIFGAVYRTNGTWLFWNNGMTSFLNVSVDFFWFDITYGQYIIACIVLLYLLCLSAAAFAFVLSKFSQNPITLIFKLIPVFAVFGALCSGVFRYTFSPVNRLYSRTGMIGAEPVVCGIALLAGFMLSLCIMQREKKADVV